MNISPKFLIFAFVIAAALVIPDRATSGSFAAASYESTTGPTKPVRRALVVGVGKYQDPTMFATLGFVRNDVAKMAELLATPRYGFEVTTMTDESADKTKLPTRANILNALRKCLIDDARAGDVCLFYFSGHGSYITNPLSDEKDGRDETIVPMDAVRPVKDLSQLRDIRDKELAELFNRALDKKVIVTAIFDSCHSGSIARGEGDGQTKEVEGVELSIPVTDAQKIKPEDRGALIITAAEDYQRANGGAVELNGQMGSYSYFTAALLQTLYTTPADLISAEDLFQKVAARLTADRTSQTPTMPGTAERWAQTIFGSPTTRSTGKVRASIATIKDKITGKPQRYVQAGLADGLTDDVELERIDAGTNKATKPPVKIRITKAEMTQSTFAVIGGAHPIKDTETFEQTTWVTKNGPNLTVWLPAAVINEQDAEAISKEIASLKAEKNVELVAEPAADQPVNMVFADVVLGKTDWNMRLAGGTTVRLGPTLTTKGILDGLGTNRPENTKIFVNIPPTADFRNAIKSKLADGVGGIVVGKTPESANYELVGRVDTESQQIKYAWMLRTQIAGQGQKKQTAASQAHAATFSLPRITDWVGADQVPQSTDTLRLFAQKLGKIRGWLKLSSPIVSGSGEFPYHLEIRQRGTSPVRVLRANDPMNDSIAVGKEYDLFLAGNAAALKNSESLLPEFYVYLMNIDSNGNCSYFDERWIRAKNGGLTDYSVFNPPKEIRLTSEKSPLTVTPAPRGVFGTEIFILLVSSKPLLSTSGLRFGGVRKLVGNEKGGPVDPLKDLLSGMGAGITTKGDMSTPDTWAVQQLILRSVEK